MLQILLLLCSAVAGIVIPGSTPDPSQVSINNITYGGTGCPTGSVGQYLSPDLSTFTLMFSSFTAQVGPNIQPTDARKYCQINLNLHYPQGWQLSVMSTTFRGFVGLNSEVTAQLSALYYFSGPQNLDSVRTVTTFNGPEFQPYTVTSNVGIESLVWSKCGVNWPLNIGTAVEVESVNAMEYSGFIEDDTDDGNIRFITGVQWKRCP